MATRPGRGKKAAANDDNFENEGGPDGAAKQRRRGPKGKNAKANGAADDDDKNMGHNQPEEYDGEFLARTLVAIHEEEAKIKSIKVRGNEQIRQKCAPMKKKIKELKDALADASYPTKEVNGLLRQDRKEQESKDDAITANFDDEQKERFRRLKEARDEFLETSPLGQAALRAEEQAGASVN